MLYLLAILIFLDSAEKDVCPWQVVMFTLNSKVRTIYAFTNFLHWSQFNVPVSSDNLIGMLLLPEVIWALPSYMIVWYSHAPFIIDTDLPFESYIQTLHFSYINLTSVIIYNNIMSFMTVHLCITRGSGRKSKFPVCLLVFLKYYIKNDYLWLIQQKLRPQNLTHTWKFPP
jgi:hypothetical protein